MIRAAATLPVLLVLASAIGCASVAVYVEHDPTATFEGLAAWEWAGRTVRADGEDDPILDARVRSAVEAELAARGFQERAGGTADFFVGYSAAVSDTLQSVTIDRYAGYTQSTYLSKSGTSRDYPRETAGQTKVVYEYKQGSLILDVFLPEPRRLIWRAYSREIIDPHENQAARDRKLKKAVRLMLKEFPPR